MADVPSLNPQHRRRALLAVIACISTYGITLSLLIPLLALILESRGEDGTVIGLLSAMASVGTLVASPFIPRLMTRVPVVKFLAGCVVLQVVAVLLLPVFDNLPAWFAIRFIMGAGGAGLFVASETWINEIAEDHSRGRVIGLYTTALSVSFALGPTILAFTGITGLTPFLVGAVLLAVAGVPLAFAGSGTPSFHGQQTFGLVGFAAMAPLLVAGALLSAFMESASLGLLPVYSVRSGLDPRTAAITLTAVAAGSMALQIPIGWLADRYNRFRLLMICAALGALGSATLSLTISVGVWRWVHLFVWGGVFSGLYTLVLIIAGHRFRGAELATANAAFGVCWGVGAMVGPVLSGAAMDVWDPQGFPGVLCVAGLVFLVFGVTRRRRYTNVAPDLGGP